MSDEKQPRKASSVRHTRAIQRDRTKHPVAAPSSEQVKERLTEIVHPVTLTQVGYFRSLGLRERTLGLVVMVAFVLEMVWRQISGVCEMVRIVQTEAVLWASPKKFSQQSLATPDDFAVRVVSEDPAGGVAGHAAALGRTAAAFAT